MWPRAWYEVLDDCPSEGQGGGSDLGPNWIPNPKAHRLAWHASADAVVVGVGRALGAGQNLKEFDIDNKYGAAAVKQVLNSIIACTQGHEASAVTTTEVRHARAEPDDDGAVVQGVVSGISLSHGSGAKGARSMPGMGGEAAVCDPVPHTWHLSLLNSCCRHSTTSATWLSQTWPASYRL